MEKNERLLIEKLQQKDPQALHTLYKSYHSELCSFVTNRLSDPQIAEELTQDILIQFLESIRDFRFQCSVKTFLFTIARNKVIDHIRKKKVKKVLFSHLPSFIVDGLATVVMDEDLERHELTQKLEHTFNELPHDYQLVLRLKYIDNKSVKEISEVLVRSFKSTESLLFRARKAFIEIYSSLA